MTHRDKDPMLTRSRLHQAALRAVVHDGPGASVRAIARGAGVTEGALYRHYPSREELLGAVYAELVGPMVAEKENLVRMRAPLRDRLREWVRCTYACHDRDAEAFAYVFLTDHALPAQYATLPGRQSALLREMILEGRAAGELRAVPPDLCVALFIGLLLSVPARIRAGALAGPAGAYIDEVARAAWLALAADAPA